MNKLYKLGEKGILAEIDKKVREEPIELWVELFTNKSTYSNRLKGIEIADFYRKEFKNPNPDERQKEWSRVRRSVIRATLETSTRNKNLESSYDITTDDLQDELSRMVHIRLYLNNCLEEGFYEYAFQKAKQGLEVEEGKVMAYEKGIEPKGTSLLRKILSPVKFQRENKMPRLLIERKIFSVNKDGETEIVSLHNELETLKQKFKDKEITRYKFDKDRKSIKMRIKRVLAENRDLMKDFFLDKESNMNLTYIKAFGEGYLNKNKHHRNHLHVSSIPQGEEMIGEYVKWFNDKYAGQIKETQRLEKAKNDQQRRAVQSALKIRKKQERDNLIIELSEEGKRSPEISKITGFKERTIRRVLEKYKEGTLTYKQVENPETNQPFNAYELDKEEERKLIKQEMNRIKEEQQKQVEEEVNRLHTLKFNPTRMKKQIKLPLKEIIKIHNRLGLEPHFDYKLATPEELEKERIAELEERSRKKLKPLGDI